MCNAPKFGEVEERTGKLKITLRIFSVSCNFDLLYSNECLNIFYYVNKNHKVFKPKV